ncbi:MAG: PmoA family protein [Phycisphaerae bacterium]|nr:PmoA family protein [Phycisphaerae bacterium]
MFSSNVLRRVKLVTAIIALLLPVSVALAAEKAAMKADDKETVVIKTGDKGVPFGPVCMQDAGEYAGPYIFRCNNGRWILPQSDGRGRVWWWNEEPLPPNQTITSKMGVMTEVADDRVQVKKNGDEAIDVFIDGKLFTTMHFKKSEPRVYLYPLIGPTGVGVTRDYIMKDTEIERDNIRQDHPHHRSMWTAFGDVRIKDFDKPGYNFWSEPGAEKVAGAAAASQTEGERPKPQLLPKHVVTKINRMVSGPVFGQIEAEIEWRTPEGVRVLTETRTYTFFAGDKDERIIDQANVLKFNDMDVKFGDTKEGGILSLRLAVTMDETGVKKPKELHGQVVNSEGGVGSKECWGKRANWCDYVGPLDGQTVGVAVFDNPKNFRHPTRWHVRYYGLYTANPFGESDFTEDKSKDGSHMFKKGESVEFNYRVIIHKADTKAAQIDRQWDLYSSPPEVTAK